MGCITSSHSRVDSMKDGISRDISRCISRGLGQGSPSPSPTPQSDTLFNLGTKQLKSSASTECQTIRTTINPWTSIPHDRWSRRSFVSDMGGTAGARDPMSQPATKYEPSTSDNSVHPLTNDYELPLKLDPEVRPSTPSTFNADELNPNIIVRSFIHPLLFEESASLGLLGLTSPVPGPESSSSASPTSPVTPPDSTPTQPSSTLSPSPACQTRPQDLRRTVLSPMLKIPTSSTFGLRSVSSGGVSSLGRSRRRSRSSSDESGRPKTAFGSSTARLDQDEDNVTRRHHLHVRTQSEMGLMMITTDESVLNIATVLNRPGSRQGGRQSPCYRPSSRSRVEYTNINNLCYPHDTQSPSIFTNQITQSSSPSNAAHSARSFDSDFGFDVTLMQSSPNESPLNSGDELQNGSLEDELMPPSPFVPIHLPVAIR